MAPHNLPPSRGARWRRKAFSLVSVVAIAAALTLSGGASASADDGTTAETSAVQTTESAEPTVEEPAPEEEPDQTTSKASEEVIEEDVVEQTPESKTNSDSAPEQDAVEEEAPAEETFAKLLVEETYTVSFGDLTGECFNNKFEVGTWLVPITVTPVPADTFTVFAYGSNGHAAAVSSLFGASTATILLSYGGEDYDLNVAVSSNTSVNIGFKTVSIPSCLAPVVTHVTPTAPTIVDNGDGSGTITIPSQEGVQYQIDGSNVGSGNVTLAGSGTVSAVPVSDQYVLDGTTSWSYDFTSTTFPTITLTQGQGCISYDVTVEGEVPADAQIGTGVLYGDPGNPFSDGPTHYIGPGIVSGQHYTISVALSSLDPAGINAPNYPGVRAVASYSPHGGQYTEILLDRSCFPVSPVVTHVTPTAPTFTDNGDGSGSITIPADQPGVQYQIDGVNTGPGTYPATGSGSVTAVPTSQDYVLDGDTCWEYDFGTPTNEDTPVSAGEVVFIDLCGTVNDTYTIPETAGVEYLVSNVVVAAGTHPGTGTVTVVAQAVEGYKLVGTAEWSATFTDVPCEGPPVNEEQYATAVAGECGAVIFTNRFDQEITVLYGDRSLPSPDDGVEVGVGESVQVSTERGFLDWVAYVTSDYRFAGNGGVEVQQDCDVPPPVTPEPPVAPVPPVVTVVYPPAPADVAPAPVVWVNVVVQAAAPAAVDATPVADDDGYYDPFYQATGWADHGTTGSGGDQFILPSLAFLLAVAYLVRRRLLALLRVM